MKIHILAGGPDEHMPPLHQSNDVKWVGVDRGVFLLLQQDMISAWFKQLNDVLIVNHLYIRSFCRRCKRAYARRFQISAQ